MKEKIKNNLGVIILILLVILTGGLKQYLVSDFPIVAYIYSGEDDALMVKFACTILEGDWLGSYRYNTLMKGPTFPILLALMYKANMPYIFTTTIFYTISCIILIIALRKSVKNKFVLFFLYLMLLFNPVTYSRNVTQRVYRNSFVPSFSFFIMSGYIAIYLRRNEKIIKLLPWFLLEVIALPLFYYIREDSIWIVPFLVFIIGAISISIIINKKNTKLNIALKIVMLLMPVIFIKVYAHWICLQNEKYYGLRTENVAIHSNYAAAMEAIYSVKPNKEIDYINVTMEKIDRMAQESESFAIIAPKLKEAAISYGQFDRDPNDGELEDGWFSWAIRTAAVNTGYTTLTDEQELFAKICTELNAAMNEGRLERQKTLPFYKSIAWKARYNVDLINNIFKTIVLTANLNEIEALNDDISVENKAFTYGVAKFEELTNNRAIYEEKDIETEEKLNNQNEYIESLKLRTKILDVFIKIYIYIDYILGTLAIISYVILTIYMIRKCLKKSYEIVEDWIIVSSVLGTLFILIFMVAFVHTTTVYAIIPLYLCGAYGVLILFSILSIYMLLKNILYDKLNKEKRVD